MEQRRDKGTKINAVDEKEYQLLVTAHMEAIFQAVIHVFSREEAIDFQRQKNREVFQIHILLLIPGEGSGFPSRIKAKRPPPSGAAAWLCKNSAGNKLTVKWSIPRWQPGAASYAGRCSFHRRAVFRVCLPRRLFRLQGQRSCPPPPPYASGER